MLLLSLSIIMFLFACGGNSNLTPDSVYNAFKDSGFRVENPRDMTEEDYGIAPMKANDDLIFEIPSSDGNGRIFSFDNQQDLNEMKKYYETLGEIGGLLSSYTIKHKNILVQLNGDVSANLYHEFKHDLESM